RPNSQRFSYVTYALQNGYSIDEIHRLTRIDPWFLDQVSQVMEFQETLDAKPLGEYTEEEIRTAKEFGLSDRRLSFLTGASETDVREHRRSAGIVPVYKRVDTCGAEFESYTPYLYSTYEEECEAEPTERRKIMILGSGPNRIGQGIEFDYCCCHASFALQGADFETIMVNCN
ncbi:MAG: carbamoyl phosphate synthase large subunit, partial [Gemmatimonadetes bacterium]|nr:carbamoyl phosphate synthase large subunit [Gemmatimonadota bacterium]